MPDKHLLLATLIWAMPTLAASGEPSLFDPTRPLTQPASSGSGTIAPETSSLPHLQAIFAQGRRLSVLINGQRLSVGDSVGGYRITEIGPTTTRLIGPKGNIQLHLGLASMKRLAQEAKP